MMLNKRYRSDINHTAISTLSLSAVTEASEALNYTMPFFKTRTQHDFTGIPRTTNERMQTSVCDRAFDDAEILSFKQGKTKHETVLYLGYGSNLAAETFLGKRGIRPLSQINIVAPSITLTFDLPGLPYSEPCFANSRYRDDPSSGKPAPRPPYHKNAWKKGLVGVVYEVTKEDYAHIIATEGGGSGYHDVLVDCYVLDSDPDKEVPSEPTGTPFRAHTLYAHRDRGLREDPDYAQPSARYLKLITSGAEEHDLPKEYRHFLRNIRTYHRTTTQQQLGSFIFLAVWGPILMFFFGGARIFLGKDGTYPKWFAKFAEAFFTAVWASYDGVFKSTFGDGERTIGDDLDKDDYENDSVPSEKTPLLVEEAARVRSTPHSPV